MADVGATEWATAPRDESLDEHHGIGPAPHMLLAGELNGPSADAFRVALDAIATRRSTVTVAVVFPSLTVASLLLPYPQDRGWPAAKRSPEAAAVRRAAQLVRMAPTYARVEHIAVGGWRCLERHVDMRRYDAVRLLGDPTHRADRRRARRAGWHVRLDVMPR